MKIVYIAGPYSGDSREKIARNISIAEVYARRIAAAKIGFICPHLNSRHMEDIAEVDYHFWIKMYLTILPRCEAMFLLPGWETSSGTKKELRLAEELKIPTFFELNRLFKWAKARRS